MAQHIMHRGVILTRGGGGGGGGPGPINPWDIPGLSLMLHAPYESGGEPAELSAFAQNPTASGGDAIETASDWSGSGNDPTQVAEPNRPTWETARQNGLAVYDFGGGDFWSSANYPASGDMWIVGTILRGVASQSIIAVYNNPSFADSWTLQARDAPTALTLYRGSSGAAGRFGVWATGTPFGRFETPMTTDGADLDLLLDGVPLSTAPGAGTTSVVAGPHELQIGSYNGAAGLDGEIGTLLIFNAQPTAHQKAGVIQWLFDQWAV